MIGRDQEVQTVRVIAERTSTLTAICSVRVEGFALSSSSRVTWHVC